MAVKLIHNFPKMVNDIFLSEDYYGNSPLHQAIVNEDPRMVLFLLQNGADIHQRCYGAFFCPDDQRPSRTDSLEHEWVDVSPKTDYLGRMYYGEYPLCFAACLNQPDCVRLLRAQKADPNMRDTNGNTVLHLMVVHELPEMFDLLYKLGAKLQVQNNQDLTPLTLAAKMAKKKMFDHVLTIERDVLWTYGDVVCAAYPLAKIDSIDQTSGQLNKDSALALIVYGESDSHLDLLDGLMEDLLKEKWKAFAGEVLTKQFLAFLLYFIIFFCALIFRPYDVHSDHRKGRKVCSVECQNLCNDTQLMALNVTPRATVLNLTAEHDYFIIDGNDTAVLNSTIVADNHNNYHSVLPFAFYQGHSCHLFRIYYSNDCHTWSYHDRDFFRLCFEGMCFIGMLMMMYVTYVQVQRTGRKRFWQTLLTFPAKLIFLVSYGVILLMGIVRMGCGFGDAMWQMEHILAMLAMLTTSLHFLFFCRGFQFVGPFVLMVYKIIAGDMLRFFLIYLIFVIGFSQSFFVIFLGCNRNREPPVLTEGSTNVAGNPFTPNWTNLEFTVAFDTSTTNAMSSASGGGLSETTSSPIVENDDDHLIDKNKLNILNNAFEAMLRMFIMSIGEFAIFYKELNACPSPLVVIGKGLFLVYELVVSILLINLLIAMMARTYNRISETEKEWKRQWAKVILMMEQSLTPKDRLLALLKYSRPIGTNKTTRAFEVKWKQSTEEAKTEKEKQADALQQFREEKRAIYKRRNMDAGGLEASVGLKSRRASMRSPNQPEDTQTTSTKVV